MPLVPTLLQTAFQGFVASPPTSLAEASQKWAQAYWSYASPALAGASAAPSLAAVGFQPLAALFLTSMTPKAPNTPGTFFDDLPTNLTAFWMSPPVPFVGVNNGPVTAVPGAPALAASITAMAQVNSKGGGPNSLDTLATAIHTFTTAVIVTLVTPAGVPIVTPLL